MNTGTLDVNLAETADSRDLVYDLELDLKEYSLASFAEAVLLEYQALCKSLGFSPDDFPFHSNDILLSLSNSELTGTLTRYTPLFTGEVKKQVKEIAANITDNPYAKIRQLLSLTGESLFYDHIANEYHPGIADFEQQRLSYRIMLEIAVGHRVAGDQNNNDFNDYQISKYYFEQVINFASKFGDLPLLVEAARHMVNLKVSEGNYYQQHLDNGVTKTEHGDSIVFKQISADHTAKYLCMLATCMANVLGRLDKGWMGRGEIKAFDKDFWITFLSFFSVQSNTAYALAEKFPPKVQEAILQTHKGAVKFKGAIN